MAARGRLNRKAREYRTLGRRTALHALAVALVGALALVAVTVADGMLITGSSAAHPVSVSSRGTVPPGVHALRELPALRTAESDTFLLSDGSREVVVHDHPVNYRSAAGAWQPIDDTLQQTSDTAFQPVASAVSVQLPSSLAAGSVSIGQGSTELSFALAGAAAGQSNTTGARRSFAGVMPGVNATYTAMANGVRELLTLASAAAPDRYSYELSYGSGLHPTLAPGGGVVFRDDTGKVVYTLTAPSVQDSSEAKRLPAAMAAHYELADGGHLLELVLSKAWLEDSSRVFPVKVDPDVYFGEASDCTIANEAYVNTSLCGGALDVGVEGEGGTSVSRSLLRFDLDSIPRESQILSSNLSLGFEHEHASETPLEVEVEALTRDFTQGATWNSFNGSEPWSAPGGDYQSPFAGRQTIYPEWREGWVSFGFSPLVERWVQEPSSNHGMLLKAHGETTAGYDAFAQTDNEGNWDEPNMHIVYEPRVGDQGDDMVTGASLAGGAEVEVNAANGNMLLSSPDADYSGEGYETQLQRYYNSQDDDLVGSSFGPGWTLGMGDSTLLYSAWWDRTEAFHGPAGGWTRFDPTTPAQANEDADDLTYASSPNQELALKVNEDGTRTLTDSELGTEWLFDSSENGFPQKIVENEGAGNTISLGYEESQLSHVEDSHGDTLAITRNAEELVNKIEGTGAKTWSYAYDPNGELGSYESAEGEKTTYSYSEDRLLDEVQDPTGTYVIAYDGSEPARVTSVRRLVNGTLTEAGSEDEITSFEYASPQSPTCNSETDLGETIVRYRPGEKEGVEETETYCYDAAGMITGWNGAEEKAEEESEGTEEVPEVPADTCYENLEFPPEPGSCGEEDPGPSAEEELEEEAGPFSAPVGEVAPDLSTDLSADKYGIADNNSLAKFNIFTHKTFEDLNVTTVRKTVPWNLVWEATQGNTRAQEQLKDLEEWVKAVKALGGGKGQPLVSFYPSVCQAEPENKSETYWLSPVTKEKVPCGEEEAKLLGRPARTPDVPEYKEAVNAFFANSTLSEVKLFTAWNEPNYPSDPKNNQVEPDGKVAGEYWLALDLLCVHRKPKCLVAAGDFFDFYMDKPDNGSKEGHRYFEEYRVGMGHAQTAAFWAWHAYNDGQQAGGKLWAHPNEWWARFKQYMAAVIKATRSHPYAGPPRIWLTEQGVIFNENGKLTKADHNPTIARQIMRAYVKDGEYQLTRQSTSQAKIARFYYYQMRGEPDQGGKVEVEPGVTRTFWDSGLLFPPTNINLENSSEKPQPRRKLYGMYRYKALDG